MLWLGVGPIGYRALIAVVQTIAYPQDYMVLPSVLVVYHPTSTTWMPSTNNVPPKGQ